MSLIISLNSPIFIIFETYLISIRVHQLSICLEIYNE
jgi:hypothetical protein